MATSLLIGAVLGLAGIVVATATGFGPVTYILLAAALPFVFGAVVQLFRIKGDS